MIFLFIGEVTLKPDYIMQLRTEWFGNIRGDLLAGLVVALALIPEAIAFSIIAGVEPKIGLYASFSIAVITAIVGGRPGMISAATAATAVLMVTLVRDYGLEYLLATTVLAGLLQIIAGILKLGSLMRFVSRSVLTGFVNALAILIFMAQLPELINVSWVTYVMVAGGLGISICSHTSPRQCHHRLLVLSCLQSSHYSLMRICEQLVTWANYRQRYRYSYCLIFLSTWKRSLSFCHMPAPLRLWVCWNR